MKYRFKYVPILILLLNFVTGCKKTSQPTQTKTVVAPTFKYSSIVNGYHDLYYDYVGYPVYFAGIAEPGSTYSWNFGDSSSSAEDSPKHIYAASGTYTVSLTINDKDKALCVFNNSYNPVITVHDTPLYTKALCQVRMWHHGKKRVYNGATDTTYSLPDSSFSVTFINTFTVSVLGQAVYYYLPYSNRDTLGFEYYPVPVPEFEYRSLRYDHTTDRIEFFLRSSTMTHPTVTTEISYDNY